MTPAGYNPLRWRCEEKGCFNVKSRPKIEIFAKCLPGKCAFGDVDAMAEINGNFLLLEFKSGEPRELSIGQRLTFERLTKLSDKIRVVVVCANSETMEVRAVQLIWRGKIYPWEIATTESLQERISRWSQRAERQEKTQ